MIGWPIRTLIRLVVLPLRVLLGLRRRLGLGRRCVITMVVGPEGRRAPLAERLRLLSVLADVAADPKVQCLQIEIRSTAMGLAALQALRQAVVEVRQAGKRVVVRLDAADDRALYLASAADEIWMPPGGEVHLTGLVAPMMFYGPALQRLGLVVEVEAAGIYKSFGEPYYRGFPSAANRDASLAMIGDLHAHIQQTIAQGRGLDLDGLSAAAEVGMMGAQQAQDLGLIDHVGYPDEMADSLEEALDGKPGLRSIERYRRGRRLPDWLARLGRSMPRVAVVYLQGPVVERVPRMGSSRRVIASDEVVPVLDELRESKHVKAVVLVVESPGGSALASDLIARAVERLDAQKPVVATMESVAASGGYYVCAPAREIVARATTLTGSIGVIGGKLVVGEAMDALGVHTELLGPGADGGIGGPFRRMTQAQRARFQESLRRVYARFIDVVSTGRDTPESEVLEVAEGRVWTGQQAKANGLVDHLGGLPVALTRVQELADLTDKEIRKLTVRFDPPRFSLLNLALGRAGATLADPVGLALEAVGPSGQFVEAIRTNPEQALALEPIPWDSDAWQDWR